MAGEETRKGPWTEQEDVQLACFVSLFGERRWDFIAKVSGLNRTGKSCRLRWVNYLHPGLKRGKLTPQEEKLVLELHSRWGNRWSRIARRLPGRTDNEIKNYWRTHMRKEAQERKRSLSASSSSSSLCDSTPPATPSMDSIADAMARKDKGAESGAFGVEETGGAPTTYSMDQIWMEIASADMIGGTHTGPCDPPVASPIWGDRYDSLWRMNMG